MARVELVEREFPLDTGDEEDEGLFTLMVKQVKLTTHPTGVEYLDPDQVADLINELDVILAEMENK